jgi:hypothetical protein
MPKQTARKIVDERTKSRPTSVNGLTLTAAPPLSSHSLLLNLDADDHTQYLRTDGARTLTGNLAAAAGVTIDGVDLSAHATDANAHHARSHAITSTSDHTASGLTAGQVLRAAGATTFAWAQLAHTDLSGIGTNTHAQIDTHIGTADTHVAHSGVTITAGDGLTGGGTIAATRTLTLGTPGSATATSTNAVATTSHTHAIDSTIARSAITVSAGDGLTGGGNLTANRSLVLGTPGGLTAVTTDAVTTSSHTHSIATGAASTLTVATTNTTGSGSNLARADHTHAITSSSNPGAAASLLATDASGYLRLVRLGLGMTPTRPLDVTGDAGITGQVIAGSGAFSGSVSITNNGDLSVGTVLQVSASGTRVGINRAADSQFDLDVAGAIRGQYLIGKHAIQLASAVGVWHFDGPAPYNLDYTGSNASHMGVGGTEIGGVIYRPGRYGKAVQVAEATTNLVTNPSFETNTTGWNQYTYQTPTATWDGRTSAEAAYGEYSYKITKTDGTTTDRVGLSRNFAITSGVTYTLSAYVKSTVGTSVVLYADTGLPSTSITATASGDWQQLTITATATQTTTARLIVWSVGMAAHTMYIDAVQLEQKAYATPYCDGSLGNGHSWSGAAHASTSSRTAGGVTYSSIVPRDKYTVAGWFRTTIAENDTTAYSGFRPRFMQIGDYYNNPSASLCAYGTATAIRLWTKNTTDSGWTTSPSNAANLDYDPGDWIFLALTWDGDKHRVYSAKPGVDGLSEYVGSSVPGHYGSGAALNLTLYGDYGQDLIDELIILDYAADPKLIRAIYESDAPVFVESSVFHWRSPSRVPIWVDEFGLWSRGVSGNEILGLYGGDPRNPTGNVTKSWGGVTMEENDVVIGRAAQAAVHWDDSAGTLLIGKPSASNLLLSGGSAQMRDGSTVWGSWSSAGLVVGRVANNASRIEVSSTGNVNFKYRNGSGVDSTPILLSGNGDASFAGSITSTSGTIGGWTLASATITGGSVQLDSVGRIRVGAASADRLWIDATNVGYRLWIGNDSPLTAAFSVTKGGALYATGATISGAITATSGSFTGSITSTSGTIGGWSIGSTLSATNLVLTPGAANVAHIAAGTGSTAVTGGINAASASSDVVFWSGNTHANRASAAFRVTAGGALTATTGTILGTLSVSGSGTFSGGGGAVKITETGLILTAATEYDSMLPVVQPESTVRWVWPLAGDLTAISGERVYASPDETGALKFVAHRRHATNGTLLETGTLAVTYNRITTNKVLSIGTDLSGLASHTTFTNASNIASNSTGTGTIKMKGSTSRDSAGFIKIYIGTTAYWVPVFSAITG